MKKIYSILLGVILLLTTFTGCYDYSYSGEHPELYTVAVNSLLWNKGISTQTDRVCDSDIEVIEKDDYGRVLFKYTEKSFTSNLAFSGLLVLQAQEDDFVYYYENYNMLCKEKVSHSDVKVEFDAQEKEQLKELNDWNKEIDLKKCIKKEICTEKKDIPIEESMLEDIFSDIEGYRNHYTFYLTNDDYGRFICYSVVDTLNEGKADDKYIVLLFDEQLKCFMYEPSSYYEYQDEFKEFKEINNWNNPVIN